MFVLNFVGTDDDILGLSKVVKTFEVGKTLFVEEILFSVISV